MRLHKYFLPGKRTSDVANWWSHNNWRWRWRWLYLRERFGRDANITGIASKITFYFYSPFILFVCSACFPDQNIPIITPLNRIKWNHSNGSPQEPNCSSKVTNCSPLFPSFNLAYHLYIYFVVWVRCSQRRERCSAREYDERKKVHVVPCCSKLKSVFFRSQREAADCFADRTGTKPEAVSRSVAISRWSFLYWRTEKRFLLLTPEIAVDFYM